MTLNGYDRASYEIAPHGGFKESWKGNLASRFSLRVIKWNRFWQYWSLQLHFVKHAQRDE